MLSWQQMKRQNYSTDSILLILFLCIYVCIHAFVCVYMCVCVCVCVCICAFVIGFHQIHTFEYPWNQCSPPVFRNSANGCNCLPLFMKIIGACLDFQQNNLHQMCTWLPIECHTQIEYICKFPPPPPPPTSLLGDKSVYVLISVIATLVGGGREQPPLWDKNH